MQEKSRLMVSGVPYYFETPHVVSYLNTNGFTGVWFRQEKPLRFRAGPAGAATSAVRRDIFVEPQPQKIYLAP